MKSHNAIKISVLPMPHFVNMTALYDIIRYPKDSVNDNRLNTYTQTYSEFICLLK